jgi:hypothetical protein
MKRWMRSVIFTGLILGSSALWANAFQLETDGSAPLYQTHLDKAVYHVSTADGLGDLTIQNANGEQVPYTVMEDAAMHPDNINTKLQALKWFPVSEKVLVNTQQLQLALSGTQLNIQNNTTSTTEKPIYLVDAGKAHDPLQTLHIDWQGEEGQFIQVDVLASDDLKSWHAVGRGVLLNTSAEDGQRILQNTLQMDHANQQRYYQLVPQLPSESTFKLNGVQAKYVYKKQTGKPTVWQALNLLAREQNNQGQVMLDYEALGHYPATWLRIDLPVQNTITQVTVFARNHSNESWMRVTAAGLYHVVKDGKMVRNPDVPIPVREARYWRLQFHPAGGGIGQQTPSLSLGWVPHTVIWNARGAAPFTLQVGHQPSVTNAVMLHELMPNLGKENNESLLKLPNATLQVGHGASLPTQSAWVTPPDYKRWLLWAGLLIGVLVLAGMAWSLLKSSNKDAA